MLLQQLEALDRARQVAVELAINPNTVLRDYREMEIRGLLDTQQGTGTFVAPSTPGSYPFGCTYHPDMAGTLVVTS